MKIILDFEPEEMGNLINTALKDIKATDIIGAAIGQFVKSNIITPMAAKAADHMPTVKLCPKDANTFDWLKSCQSKNREGLCCTRRKGHKGDHHAHGSESRGCLAVWRRRK